MLPADVSPLSGLAFAADAIFVLDLAMGHLRRLDPAGRVVATMGRTGRGPGEFDPPPGVMSEGAGRFLSRRGDTLLVFDSRSIHRFTLTGAHVDSRPIPADARSFLETPGRIAVLDGNAVIESWKSFARDGRNLIALEERTFTLWRFDGDSATPLESLALPQLPRAGSGGYFGSPAEARPAWDVRDDCLAVMDGSGGRLVLGDLRTGDRDTLELPLPGRFADAAKANASLPGILPGTELPAPALLARVRDLVLDPSGIVWLRPVEPDPAPAAGIEVWLYRLGTGRFTVDTVAGFPRAFDAAGNAVRVATDEEGVTRLVPLARLRDATAPPAGL